MVKTSLVLFLLGNAFRLISGVDQIECGVPGRPAFGDFQSPQKPYDVGKQIRYVCASGWMVGDQLRTCGADGRWNGSIPFCVSPAKTQTSQIRVESAHWNSKTAVEQSEKYLDYNEATCTGQFLRQDLRIKITFSKPSILEGVKFSFDTPDKPKLKVFTVHSRGPHMRVLCLRFASTGVPTKGTTTKTSLRFRCYIDEVADGIQIEFEGNKDEFASLCEILFYPTPNDSKCDIPDTPRKGYIREEENASPKTFLYSCDSSSQLVGPIATSCRPNRTWSNVAPICVQTNATAKPLVNETHPHETTNERPFYDTFEFGLFTGAFSILLLVGIAFLVYFLRRKRRSQVRSSAQRSSSFNVSFHRNRVEHRRSSGNNYAVAFSKHPAAASAGQQRVDDDDRERPRSDIPDILDNNGGVRIRGLTNSAIGHIYADPVYYETSNAVRPEQHQRPPYTKMAENEIYCPNT